MDHEWRPMSDDEFEARIIGQRIRLARKKRRWSMKKLADSLGISYQQVQKYESGRNFISLRWLLRICRAFDVSPLWFLPGSYAMMAEGVEEERV